MRTARNESGATSSLELLALTPLLALLVLFVLWAGRSARAGLVADLAAEEAAVAASLCCNAPIGKPGSGDEPLDVQRERMAEAVLASRPGLDYLCLRGPQPADGGAGGFVTETGIDFSASSNLDGFARGARILEVHFRCETDGAVAPLRGLFPTVTMEGRATEVTVFADGPRITVTVGSVSESEEAVFTAMLSEPAWDDIELTYFTRDQTASSTTETSEPGELDFDAISEDLAYLATIPAGEITTEMFVTTLDDDVCEGNETFALVVSASGPDLVSTVDSENVIQFTTQATIDDEADCPGEPDL